MHIQRFKKATQYIAYLIAIFFSQIALPTQPTPLIIKQAYIHEAPPNAPTLAGYLTLKNPSNYPIRIERIESPSFGHIELHKTLLEDGIMRMQMQESFTIAARDTLEMQPGGQHLMLMQPKQALKAGDQITLHIHTNAYEGNFSMTVPVKHIQ